MDANTTIQPGTKVVLTERHTRKITRGEFVRNSSTDVSGVGDCPAYRVRIEDTERIFDFLASGHEIKEGA
jgi:hypothetical protein